MLRSVPALRVPAVGLMVAMILTIGIVATASAAPAPIKVGQVVTEGAAAGFPTTAKKTLQAYFKDYNAKGGFKGRKIQFSSANDKLSIEANLAVTRGLIDEGVVAFLGSFGVMNCLANSSVLRQANVYMLGYAVQAPCFSLKQYGSVVASVPTSTALQAQYARENLGRTVCLITNVAPGSDAQYKKAEQILAKLGIKFTYKNTNLAYTTDPTAALLEAKSAGCRTLVANLSQPQGIQAVNAKATQRITGMNLLLANGLDYNLLKGAGKNAEGLYTWGHMYPFSLNDSRSRAYRRFNNKHKIALDTFGEQAYITAELFVKALESIKGSVTRASVSAAISKLNTRNSLLPGQRFKYGGQGNNGAPVIGGYMLRVRNGKFVLAPKSERILPAKVRSMGGK